MATPSLSESIRRAPPLLAASLGVHGLAVAALIATPQSGPLVAAALIGNHLVIGTAGMFPRSGWLGPNITRLPGCSPGVIALTFDDGPDPDVTPQVLSLLEDAGQRATFFCVGARAEAHPALVADIRRRGHGVENHSYSHPNSFALRGPRGLAREIGRAQQALRGPDGESPRLFRAPAGIQNPWLSGVLAEAGLRLVSWTRRGFDTVSHDGARVAARLVGRGLTEGDILLLHDGSMSRHRQQRPVVLEALPRVLERMTSAGLRSEALHAALPPTLSAVVTAG